MGFCSVQLGLTGFVIGLKIPAGIPWTLLWSIGVFLSKILELESKNLQAYSKTDWKRTENGLSPFWVRFQSVLEI